jgi:hypothetical protein
MLRQFASIIGSTSRSVGKTTVSRSKLFRDLQQRKKTDTTNNNESELNSDQLYKQGREMIFGEKKTANPAKGIELWTKAKSQGNIHAAYSLAMLELNGIHMPKNPKSGFMAIQDLALKKYPYAMYALANIMGSQKGNVTHQLALLKGAAEGGVKEAHYNLYALLSEVAKTRPEFEQESMDHLHKAAEAEILLAVYALATRYSEGRGVPQNDVRAFELFKTAADKGLVYAQHNLSLLYLAGRGCEQNYKLAYQYAMLASDQGFIPATINCANMLREGQGVPADPAAAKALYLEAGFYGDTEQRERSISLMKETKDAVYINLLQDQEKLLHNIDPQELNSSGIGPM